MVIYYLKSHQIIHVFIKEGNWDEYENKRKLIICSKSSCKKCKHFIFRFCLFWIWKDEQIRIQERDMSDFKHSLTANLGIKKQSIIVLFRCFLWMEFHNCVVIHCLIIHSFIRIEERRKAICSFSDTKPWKNCCREMIAKKRGWIKKKQHWNQKEGKERKKIQYVFEDSSKWSSGRYSWRKTHFSFLHDTFFKKSLQYFVVPCVARSKWVPNHAPLSAWGGGEERWEKRGEGRGGRRGKRGEGREERGEGREKRGERGWDVGKWREEREERGGERGEVLEEEWEDENV